MFFFYDCLNITNNISNVQTIIKKNDTLQKYVAAEFGKQITLIKDCKTRWNSLLSMLLRAYLLKNCIQKGNNRHKSTGR